jgi:hypothetical protein
MDDSRFLDCLAADYQALRDAAAAAEPTAPVPCCPGWALTDLVFHVAEVYLHKLTVIRTGEWPRQWPPPGLADEPRLALLDRTYAELTAEFAARGPASKAPTWYDPDQTVAFWIRRMAQETAIHRIDAEQAAGPDVVPVSAVPDDLAVDGVDEVLTRFLGYGSVAWADEFAQMKGGHLAGQDGRDAIVVTAGQASWTVRPSPREVVVHDGGTDAPRAVIEGAPDPVLRWLWGRAPDDAVRFSGDPAWTDYLRRLLTAVTQ